MTELLLRHTKTTMRHHDIHRTFAVLTVLLGLLTASQCLPMFGLSLAPGQTLTQVITPDDILELEVFWDELGTVNISGELDGSFLSHDGPETQATATTQGSAVFTIHGQNISVGRHVLDVTATLITPNDTEVDTTMMVVIFNQRPIEGLEMIEMDADKVRVVTTEEPLNLKAQVSSGLDLTAEWIIGDATLIYQTYSPNDQVVRCLKTWKEAGTFPVMLIVSNEHNAQSTNCTLEVYDAINGIIPDPAIVTSQANENVDFRLLFAPDLEPRMGSVNMTLEWGDGTNVSVTDLNITSNGTSQIWSHTYSEQGNLNIRVTLKSFLDTEVLIVPASIWDEVSDVGMNITPSTQYGRPGDNFIISFINPPAEGFQYKITYETGVAPLKNNRSVLYSDYVEPDPASLTIHWDTPGQKLITLNAFNPLYKKNIEQIMYIENALQSEAFMVNSSYTRIPFPDGTVNVTADVQGFAGVGFCHWDFGITGGKTTPVYLSMPTNFPLNEQFTYAVPDDYTISLNCHNNVSDMTVSVNVSVRNWLMTDFEIFVDNPQVMDGLIPILSATMTLNLSLVDRLPEDVIATYNYGDGTSPHTFTVTEWATQHLYPRREVYAGTVHLSHPDKGSATLDFEVRQGAFQIDLNTIEGLVDTQDFNFTVEVPAGFQGKFDLLYGDNTTDQKTVDVQSVTAYVLTHHYGAVENFTAELRGESTQPGKLYTERVLFPGPIYIEGSVESMLLSLNRDLIPFPPGDVTFTATLNRPKHKIRWFECWVDFKDELNKEPRIWNGTLQPGESFSIDFRYKTLGSRIIEMNCSNPYSAETYPIDATAYNPCFSVDPIFDRSYGNYKTPMSVLSSTNLNLVTRTVILCYESMPDFYWWVTTIDPNNGVKMGKYDSFDQPYSDFIDFPPGALDPGMYMFTLNISFRPGAGNAWIKEETFVRIVRTPLVAEIKGGRIRLTGDRNALIDGYSLSHDPVFGIDNKTGLIFSWQCRTYDTTTLDALNDYAARPLPNGGYHDCDQISDADDTGGKRLLKVPSHIDAEGYLFKLRVEKENLVSLPAVAFVQFDQAAFSISLECIDNCAYKAAVTKNTVLEIKCDTCSDGDMLDATYDWNIFTFNNVTKNYTLVSDKESYLEESGHDNGQAVTIPEHRLDPCTRYRVEGKMKKPKQSRAKEAAAVFYILTNCPPWGGSCNITPSAGDVVTTKFTIMCRDWQDDGYEDPTELVEIDGEDSGGGDMEATKDSLYYEYFLRKNNIRVPIGEGGESSSARQALNLIPGEEGDDYEVVVRIYDALDDYVEYPLNVVLNTSSLGEPLNSTGLSQNSSTTEEEPTIVKDATNTTRIDNYGGGDLQSALEFWNNQANYTDQASTLKKQLRGLTTASSLISTYTLPEENNTLGESVNGSTVVSDSWDSVWHSLRNPPPPDPLVTEMTELTERFTKMVQARPNDTKELTGEGIAALGEGIATIMYNARVNDEESVFAGGDVVEAGAKALSHMFSGKKTPHGTNVSETVFSLAAAVDKVIESSIPSYDLNIGGTYIFNSSDMGEDDQKFMVSRVMVARKSEDRKKMNTTRTVMPRLINAINSMLESLMKGVVLGQPVRQVQRRGVAVGVGKLSGRSLGNTTFKTGSVGLHMDTVNEDNRMSDPNATVEVKANVYDKNPLAWSSDESSYEITSPVVQVNMTDKYGTRKLKKVTLTLQRGSSVPVPTRETVSTADTRDGPDGFFYHRLTLRSKSSAMVTEMAVPSGLTEAVAYFRTGRPPTRERHDVRVTGELLGGSRRKRSASNTTDDDTSSGGFGPAYKFFVPPNSLEPGIVFVGFELPELPAGFNETLLYQFMSFSDQCRVWDEKTETWDPSACSVSAFSTPQETVCICDNPPGNSFASSFFVAPNTIDFSTVFQKFDITNAAVYGTLMGLGVIWILVLIWARRKDRQDKERWLLGYLKDNLADDSYFYLVTVHTGIRKGAGTLSNVKFILTGDFGDTGVRILSDGKRTLDTGSVMTYILATTQSLGELSYLRVWHDDSGPDDMASWYLSRIVVEDLQGGERYNFICGKWLAIDKEDCQIDRIIPVTLKDEIMTFDKLFSEHARVGITDTHLWFSCFLRPERSTFTRVQRVSCCMCLLLLTMITSAMFFQSEDTETGESTNAVGMQVQIGMMRFSMTTLWTSTVSIIITTIPILLFVYLFKSYRPKSGPRAEAVKHRRTGLIQMTKASKLMATKGVDENTNQNISDVMDRMLQENPLPHYCVYLTWFLLLTTMALCAFFLLLYSMQWGKTTSEEWLTSFFMSFVESLFIMDPLKVLLLACMLAYCAGNPYFHTQHQHIDIERVQVEAENFGKDEIDPTALPPDPVPETVIEAAKKRRQQEQLAQSVFFELLLYVFFVFCVFSVSYGNRDQNTYAINKHLADLFYSADGDAPMPFETISSRKDVMKYMKETLLNTSFPWTDMVGNEIDWRQRLFTSDFTSFRVGPVRVRQVRMPARKEGAKVTRMYPSLKLSSVTYPPFDMHEEETGSYCLGWAPRLCTEDEIVSKLSLDSWKYKSDVFNAPVWGMLATFPSGGYIADFAVNRDVVILTMNELDENNWLDLQTKAVFVELSLYNPNVNLFTFVRMGAEFPEVGSVIVWKTLKTLRIYSHLGALGAYMLVCELLVLLVVIIFTVKAIKKIKRQGIAYFKDIWQVMDLCCLAVAYITTVFYVIKLISVNEAMDLWRQDPKVYVDFYPSVLLDETYGYILAGLVFILSIRLLRVLGYNRRITMIGTVLARSGKSLLGFMVVFFIIMTAYVTSGVVLFASTMYEFRNVWETYLTLYVLLLGKNVLGRFINEAPLYLQGYFFSLTILVIFILYTMFQAILCNTTSMVRSDLDTVPAPYGLTNVLAKFYRVAIADWVPRWLVKARTTTIEPTDPQPTAGLVPGYQPTPGSQKMPSYKDEKLTQSHRVLATLSDHFNKFYKNEEQKERKKKRPRKKEGFSSLN